MIKLFEVPPKISTYKMLNIDVLPCEILLKIFRHFNLADRKNARLTCKYWYRICYEFLVGKFELKSNDPNFDLIIDVISRSGFDELNLKFVATGSKMLSPPAMNLIWSKCGPQIKFLKLKKCSMSADDLKQIITQCTNLQNLVFKECDVTSDEKVIVTLLEALIDDSIKIISLISLQFYSCEWATITVYDKFCSLYPKLKKVHLNSVAVDWELNTYNYLINKLRTSKEKLDSLNLNWNNHEMFKDKELLDISAIPNLRLKELCVSWNVITWAGLNQFLTRQTWLQRLDLCDSFKFKPSYVRKLLECCPNLRTLKISCTGLHFFSVLKIVATSRLKALDIDSNYVRNIPYSNTRFENHDLNSLEIDSLSLPHAGYLWIVKVFRRLQCVYTRRHSFVVTDRFLQRITRYQTDLKQIDIYGFEMKSADPILKTLSKLEDLEHLEFCSCEKMNFEHLFLPKLKRLQITTTSIAATDWESNIVLLCKNNPSIEYFLFLSRRSFNNVDDIITNLPKLRTLKMKSFPDNYSSNITNEVHINTTILQNHQTIRCVTIEICDGKNYDKNFYIRKYTFSIFTKQWKEQIHTCTDNGDIMKTESTL